MAYPNRTDLQNTAQKVARRAATGQTYGKATEQLRAQQAVPMASGDVTTPAPEMARPTVTPGSLGALDRLSERPGEPVTAGAALGPGPTAAQLGLPSALGNLNPVEEIRALYELYPNDDLAALLENAINTVS